MMYLDDNQIHDDTIEQNDFFSTIHRVDQRWSIFIHL